MSKVYKSKQGEEIITALYDKQAKALNVDYEDLYVDTRFGKTHVLKLGNQNGKPLLFLHGGNSTTPFYLGRFPSLYKNFCIYAADIVGHPGKSSQTIVSHKTMEYGEWASDVITGFGFEKMNCLGGSFGGGVIVKLMCVAPEKIERAVLIVPSGIANVSTLNISVSMGIPMMFYVITGKDKWLKKAILPMAVDEKNIDDATYEMVKASFEHVTVKTGMPSNVKAEDLQKCNAPTFLIAGASDCMFPGKKVIAKAKKIMPNIKTYLLENQGHMFMLPDEVLNMIDRFILD